MYARTNSNKNGTKPPPLLPYGYFMPSSADKSVVTIREWIAKYAPIIFLQQ
jgi:hypothetical protein